MPNTAHEVRWCGRGVDRLARAANFASKFEDVSERKSVIAYAKAATTITWVLHLSSTGRGAFRHKFATRNLGPRKTMADFCGLQRIVVLWQKRPRRAAIYQKYSVTY